MNSLRMTMMTKHFSAAVGKVYTVRDAPDGLWYFIPSEQAYELHGPYETEQEAHDAAFRWAQHQ
jgi:hypothetical protein